MSVGSFTDLTHYRCTCDLHAHVRVHVALVRFRIMPVFVASLFSLRVDVTCALPQPPVDSLVAIVTQVA